METAYLSLGSNLGDRVERLRAAITRLGGIGHVAAISCFYETEPVEVTEQPWFVNCAVALETSLEPEELMAALLRIERTMGRERVQKKGPRTIDIDILLYGERVLASEAVVIPHPAMGGRSFVLEPLAEIAGDVKHPVVGKTVKEMVRELGARQVVRKVE